MKKFATHPKKTTDVDHKAGFVVLKTDLSGKSEHTVGMLYKVAPNPKLPLMFICFDYLNGFLFPGSVCLSLNL